MPVRVLILLLPLTAHAEPGPPPRAARFDRHGYLLPAGAVARLGVPPSLSGLTADLAWTPDGKQFVAADWTTITRFDAATGRAVETITIDAAVRNLFTPLSRDARTLFRISGRDCTLHDTAAGDRLVTFELFPVLNDPDRTVQSLTLSSDQRFLAGLLAGRGGPAVAWRHDLARGRSARVLREWANLRSILLSPDGRRAYAVAGTDPAYLIAHDLAPGRDLWAVELGRPGSIRAVSPDGRRLVLADGTRFLVFDTAAGKEVVAVPYPANPIIGLRPVDLSPDGKLLAVADDAAVTVWDIDAGKMRYKLPHSARIVAFSPDGKSLLSANAWVQKWDVATGKPAYPEPGAGGGARPAPRLHWSGDGKRLLVAWPRPRGQDLSPPTDLTLWEAGKDAVWRARLSTEPSAVTSNDAGSVVRAFTGDRRLMSWTVGAAPTALAQLAAPIDTIRGQPRAEFLRDGRLVVLWRGPETVAAVTYDAAGRAVGQHTLPPRVIDERLGPDAPLAGMEGLLYGSGRRIDATTGRARPPAVTNNFSLDEIPIGSTRGLTVSPARMQGQRNPLLGLGMAWDDLTGRLAFWIDASVPEPGAGAVSPDSRWMAAATDRGVDFHLLRPTADGRERPPVRFPGSKPSALAFCPDSRRLAAAHPDGTVVVWAVPAPAAEAWAAADPDRLWTALAADDPKVAWQALWHLLDHPAEATALLRARLQPVPELKDVAGLIAKLDHPRYPVREAASKALADHGEAVEGDVMRALAGPISPEQRERLGVLFKKLDPTIPPAGGTLRGLRCVWLLERIGSPEAKALLADLAAGASGSRITSEAKAAASRAP